MPDDFETLLASADVAHGGELTETIGCNACHVIGAVNNIAPSYEGIGRRAARRQPPLSGAAYIYESIVNPNAYTVPDYPPSMPQNYGEILTDEQIADIVAFLLTQ
jgi:mono/diheme cytochrome c family protein